MAKPATFTVLKLLPTPYLAENVTRSVLLGDRESFSLATHQSPYELHAVWYAVWILSSYGEDKRGSVFRNATLNKAVSDNLQAIRRIKWSRTSEGVLSLRRGEKVWDGSKHWRTTTKRHIITGNQGLLGH
jgi:hypothetical protein